MMQTSNKDKYIVEMRNICKSFPGVKALENVDLYLSPGKVLGLIGENGAGKSTLMNILSGVFPKDSGVITFKGKEINPLSPREANELGISIIHQELSVVHNLNIMENIFLGRDLPHKYGLIDWKQAERFVLDLMKELGIDLEPKTLVKKLSIGQMQMVEIIKAFAFNADIIIMDEPTSALTDAEVARLFRIIEMLKKKNVGIIYVSHRLQEILDLTDNYTVLRDGRLIDQGKTSKVETQDLVRMMVGREIGDQFPEIPTYQENGQTVMQVKSLSRKGVFHNIDFSLNKGEILGIAGLMGAGRTELVRAIFGADHYDSGEVYINDSRVDKLTPSKAISVGVGLVPEDRRNQGLLLNLSVKENITLASMDTVSTQGYINIKHEKQVASRFISQLGIKVPSMNQRVSKLSGGNQQKVVISKWLALNTPIMIFDEPTRGLDVGAKREVYGLIAELSREKEISIILISSELPEILALCDRTIVMHEGEITGCFVKQVATEEEIMEAATGGGNIA